jgi:dihydroorotase
MNQEWIMYASGSQSELLAFNTNAKVSPPLRRREDNQALVEGLEDGSIDAIATDHAPHALIDKNCEIGLAAFGISGFETALGSLLKLFHESQLDLNTLIGSLTFKPAGIIGKGNFKRGTLEPGSIADITVFNPNITWRVNPSEFISKGKNTPLEGYTMTGRVLYTIANGNLAYEYKNS